MSKIIVTTSDADLITYHAASTNNLPPLYFDQLSGKVVADVPTECREAFQNDEPLQRFLSAKKSVWRAISEQRNRGGRL